MGASDSGLQALVTRASQCSQHGDFQSNAYDLPNPGRNPIRIWTKCPLCSKAEVDRDAAEKVAQERQTAQRFMEQRLKRSGIPRRFIACSFDNYQTPKPWQQKALAASQEFAKSFNEHKQLGATLVLSGKIGTGKGHLAATIAKHVIGMGESAFMATAREIILMMRASWSDPSEPSEVQVLRMLKSVSLLVIDEIGVQSGSDSERDQLFDVIDGRYREMMPTICTTNINKTAMQKTLGERSFSRLREDGIWVVFGNQDGTDEDYRAEISRSRACK